MRGAECLVRGLVLFSWLGSVISVESVAPVPVPTSVAVPARILFLFPHAFHSHYRAFVPLVEELAARGHHITAYTAPVFKRSKPLQNYKEVLVHLNPNATTLENFDFQTMTKKTVFGYTIRLWSFVTEMTDDALQSEALRSLMESQEKFDLIIMEATMQQEALLGFGHKFGAPVVNLHPLFISPFIASLMGAPNPLSYIPDFRLPYTDHMTFGQRVYNTLLGGFDLLGGYFFYLSTQEQVMRRNFKFPDSEALPPLRDLVANVSLHLVDAHPMMTIRPYSPNVIDVAGMANKPSRGSKLPQDIKKFMDEATEGVIYFSFGSHIEPSLFPPHVKRVFIETLKNLKQRVIWKWTGEIEGNPKNILQKSWLPQADILAHPNCKLFITHGGFNSLVEMMTAGVPALGLPIFADQYHNVAYYESSGVGLGASVDSLTVDEFTEKIKRIVYTPSFAENAKRLSNIFQDLPQTSLEKAVHWVEYVIRHQGAHHLKPASVTLPYYKYLLLDVFAFCAFSTVLIIYALFWIINRALSVAQPTTKKELNRKKLSKKHN